MKYISRAVIICIIILSISTLSLGVLKKGEPFKPFSLISTKDIKFTVTLEEGKLTLITESLSDGTINKSNPDAVLIDFWATWCVPCRAAMPYMQDLSDKYKPAPEELVGGMRLLGIALDRKGNKVVKPFFERLKFTYPMLADPTKGEDGDNIIHSALDMKKEYKVQGIPVVYLIDKQGIITQVHTGFKKKHIAEIEHEIESIIVEKSQ